MGARFKPGAFHAITGLPASKAMDTYLPLNDIDSSFDTAIHNLSHFYNTPRQFNVIFYLNKFSRRRQKWNTKI